MAEVIDDRFTSSATAVLEQSMEHKPIGTVLTVRVPEPAPTQPPGASSLLLCVVVSEHEHEGRPWWNIHACHSMPEMATDFDPILRGVTPYPLVVMAELHGQCWADQAVRVVGQVDEATVKAIKGSLWSDGESVASYERGMPLGSLFGDPRRAWIEGWLPSLLAVSSPVRRLLLGDF